MSKQDYPRISCIMPTADRGIFIPQSIKCFFSQDYPNKELIIIDDGHVPVKNLVPRHPDIRYYYYPPKKSIGEKRNIACQESTGDFIQHWDDDDWIAPAWLSGQYQTIVQGGANMTGMRNLRFYDPLGKNAWLFSYIYPRMPRVCGATLLYAKSLWSRRPFQHISRGEDDLFIKNNLRKKLIPHNQIHLYAARIHPDNTIDRKSKLRSMRSIDFRIIEEMMNGQVV